MVEGFAVVMNAQESQRSLDEAFSTIVEDYSGQAYNVALGILAGC